MKTKFLLFTVVIFAAALGHAAPKTGYAPVNGLNIYYEIHGKPNKNLPPLVLLHGGGSTIGTSFGSVLPALAKKRQVIAFEQQGHGHTADVERAFSFDGSADDTAALLKYLKVPQADFLGYSNGGTIALKIAARHPKLVRKVVAASALVSRDGVSPEFWEGMKNASLENMPAELKEAYLKTSPHPDKLQSFHDKSVKRMLEFRDWLETDLRSLRVPVLILTGDVDVIRPEHAVRMYRLIPGSQLAILPGVDHMALAKKWPVTLIEKYLE